MRFLNTLLFLCGVLLLARPTEARAQFRINANDTAIFASDTLIARGEHFHSVVVLYGNIDFRGETEEMVILAGHVKLRSGARISKSLVVMGGAVDQEDGASVAGDAVTIKAPEGWYRTIQIASPLVGALFSGGLWFISSSLWILTSWGIGLILFYLLPGFTKRTRRMMKQEKIRSFFVSCLAVLCFVPGLILLIVSIVGIALIPLYLFLFGIAWYMGHLVGAAWLGEKLAAIFKPKLSWQWQLLIGIFLSVTLGTLLPFWGKMIWAFLLFIATGAVWRAWREAL